MLVYVVLAILQGLTEFLPVSSSGHQALFNAFFTTSLDSFFYMVILHLGTIFSLLVFFYKDIKKGLRDIKLLKHIFIVTIISGLFGFLGRSVFKQMFFNTQFVFIALGINGLMLLYANKRIKSAKNSSLNLNDVIFLALAQVVGMFPGISRSGATITILLSRGLKREEAFRFSFLGAIPIIFLAFMYECISHRATFCPQDIIYYLAGFIISFVVGYFSLYLLSLVIKKSRLDVFGYYCLFVFLITLFLR